MKLKNLDTKAKEMAQWLRAGTVLGDDLSTVLRTHSRCSEPLQLQLQGTPIPLLESIDINTHTFTYPQPYTQGHTHAHTHGFLK